MSSDLRKCLTSNSSGHIHMFISNRRTFPLLDKVSERGNGIDVQVCNSASCTFPIWEWSWLWNLKQEQHCFMGSAHGSQKGTETFSPSSTPAALGGVKPRESVQAFILWGQTAVRDFYLVVVGLLCPAAAIFALERKAGVSVHFWFLLGQWWFSQKKQNLICT